VHFDSAARWLNPELSRLLEFLSFPSLVAALLLTDLGLLCAWVEGSKRFC
jgi:hypothetical protein